MKQYYFVRHGETDYNRKGIVQGSGVDSELNLEGHEQALKFYNHYKDEAFDFIYCSALTRSYQTILPFIQQKQIPFQKTPLINEISWGDHEGKKGTPEMIASYKRMVERWAVGDFEASLSNAESARELAHRLDAFLKNLTQSPYEKVLICTHGRSLRCLLCLMKNQHLKEMENYSHDNTGLFLAHFEDGKFSLELENDTSHLISVLT